MSGTFIRDRRIFSQRGGGEGNTTAYTLAATFSSSADSLTTVTGIGASLISGRTYRVEVQVMLNRVGANGCKIAVSGPAMSAVSRLSFTHNTTDLVTRLYETSTSNTFEITNNITASTGFVRINGMIVPTANGDFTIQLKCNISGQAWEVLSGTNMLITEE